MPVAPYVPGIPGVRALKTAIHYVIFKGGYIPEILPQGKLIDGVNSRDPGNGIITSLRPGTLMGKITATGLYAPSVMGTLVSGGTVGSVALTVSTATATELIRRVGASGTFKITGPAVANGVIQQETVTYSAVVAATGVITCTATVNAYVAGSFIQPTDGSERMITFIPDGYPIPVVDSDGVTNLTVQFPELPVAGTIIAANLLPWPTDTSLQGRIIEQINGAGFGRFSFDVGY